MTSIQSLITDHIDIWTSADTEKKSGRGRASGSAASVYGVKKLRELILEWAVRGKLVPQDASDEPASELLKRIEAEKTKLIAEGKIKKSKPLSEINANEKPFVLPKGWEWVRLSQVSDANTGYAFKSGEYTHEGTLVLRVTNINTDGTLDLSDVKYIDTNAANTTYQNFQLKDGDVLLVMVGGSLGKLGVVEEKCLPAVLNQNMWKMTRFGDIERDYFLFGLRYINSSQIEITNSTHGHLAQGEYLTKLFPLPPLAEQHRIVAKVDELMALCDQLENQHSDAIAAHEKLVSYLLDTLTKSQNADEFQDNWQRIVANFDVLFTTEYSIEQLKQTVLQLAVMGKLVKQDPSDEPASELLKKIADEKAKLIKEGKIKKSKPLPEITEDEKPFELPSGWVYTKIADLCRPISSGSTPSADKFTDSGVPFLKVYNIRDQKIDFSYKEQFVDEDTHVGKLSRSRLYPNDVVMNIVGPPLGKIAIIPDDYPEWNCNQAIVFFGLLIPELSTYLYTYLCEGSFINQIELIGTAGQDNISVTKSQNIVMPLPPLNEQKRIVEKVNQLFSMIEQLQVLQSKLQKTKIYLADALVANAVEGV